MKTMLITFVLFATLIAVFSYIYFSDLNSTSDTNLLFDVVNSIIEIMTYILIFLFLIFFIVKMFLAITSGKKKYWE